MTKFPQRTAETFARSSPQRMAMMLVAIVLVLAFRYWSERNGPAAQPDVPAPEATANPQATPVAEKPQTPKANATTQSAGASDSSRLVIRNVSLRNQDGRVIYRGDIDLRPTLERIDAGKKLRFPNDGSVFQNREGRLPPQSSGHYREWVVPTPDEDGPGPQRIVTGSAGEAWYTADHYRTFQRLPREARRGDDTKNRRNDE
jgi:ribonuclease T1